MMKRQRKFLKVLAVPLFVGLLAGGGAAWQARARDAAAREPSPYSLSFSQILLAQAASEASETYRIESSGSVALPAGTIERKGAYLICNVIDTLEQPPQGPVPAGAAHWMMYR